MTTSEVARSGEQGRSVSVKDVASAAGVSVGTVSNVLNRPEKVSPATLEHVQRVIGQLGFVRNDAARQLRAGTNRAVGMVVLDVRNPFFTDVARGVELRLGEHRRPLILGSSGQDAERESTYLDLFEEQRVSGLLITPVGKVLPRLRRLRERGTQVVVVDRRTGSREFSSVAVDDVRGGRIAATHLVDAGRTRLAFIGGPQGLTQIRHRLRGAEAVVADHPGASLRFVETGTMDADAGRQGAESLLALPRRERPDAIFAANDLVALGVLQAHPGGRAGARRRRHPRLRRHRLRRLGRDPAQLRPPAPRGDGRGRHRPPAGRHRGPGRAGARHRARARARRTTLDGLRSCPNSR